MHNHNPGKIIEKKGIDQWQTTVGPFKLNLDIIPVKEKFAIASFVVMEQDQNFLDYCGRKLAKSIKQSLADANKAILITAESKGSHFIPWVWHQLKDKVHPRIITLRKGKPKVYMNNPPNVSYQSITSPNKQNLNLSNKDFRLLKNLNFNKHEPIFVDDFIGKGGTIIAVCKLFKKAKLPTPKTSAVIGSDGNLYKNSFKNENLNMEIIPKPFLLKLPTFVKTGKNSPWKENE